MSYYHSEPPLDFEEANAFLAALADTVPLLEKPSDWHTDLDLDQLGTPVLGPRLEPLSPEIFSLAGSVDEMFAGTSQGSDYPNPLATLYSRNDDPFSLSADEVGGSYPNLLGLTMSPYLDLSPNSGPSSLHLPVIKKELDIDAPYDFGSVENADGALMVKREPDLDMPYEFGGVNRMPANAELQEQVAAPTLAAQPRPKTKSKVAKPERKPKTSHNVIEKKYRTSINSKILELREVVPTLKFALGKTRVLMADLDGLSPACKLNKASILTKANEYIIHMKKKNRALENLIRELQTMVNTAELQMVSPVAPQQPVGEYTSYFEPQNTSSTLFQRRVPPAQQTDEPINNYASLADMNPRTVPSQHPPQQTLNANMFFGGLATLMGSSYINDNNFQTLSALPVVPTTLFRSPAVLLLVHAARVLTAGLGLLMIISYLVGSSTAKAKTQNSSLTLWDGMRFPLNIGLSPRKLLDASERATIMTLLTGHGPTSTGFWIRTYVRLRANEANFETLLLQFLVGTVISRKNPILSKVVTLDLRLKKNTFRAAKYVGENEDLKRISLLFQNVDGLLMFESDSFAQRLFNLAHGIPVSLGIRNGENVLLYVDSLLKNAGNFYAIVFEWRVLELLHELTLVYLDLMVSPNDDDLEDLKNDSLSLSSLIPKATFLGRQFSYFQLLLSHADAPEVLKNDKKYILNALTNIDLFYEEPELTDDEYISEDDSAGSLSDDEFISQHSPIQKRDAFELIKHRSSMLCSFNLMNEEKFTVLISSLVSFYSEKDETEKLLMLLDYLKLNENKVSMSLLSFTCLLKLFSSIVKPETEEAETETQLRNSSARPSNMASDLTVHNCLVLEGLVKSMRGWLNDKNKSAFLTNRLRTDLSDLIVSRSIALNKL